MDGTLRKIEENIEYRVGKYAVILRRAEILMNEPIIIWRCVVHTSTGESISLVLWSEEIEGSKAK